ncbi:Myb-like DNA-binding domain containing protein [Trichomonas vaginalis G3]|uniref:Myb-like DNA-binding domain containing protein n=1 Tax=Trichomonas vaginalis (strain ATCC PRA-98 / G3) TaxID=412133 RepID=A2FPG2_TRIV3|nr:RNA polymerase II transcription regulator recruiting protein [Trichomonas vaginalis G3]EAX93197.1 Myb-like DNA-binding domain containing protein [Trichomonas vaginalis G3]KAI5540036.1 RNA polymerase II transcription regulator recruiting protein [Trichomonas vaginalis G3]|eukprot:XP_001306127.1 Myb-like DNA-binding domain containing protein [Trichomonas vaginalis G3]
MMGTSGGSRSKFTEEEDRRLSKIISQLGTRDWEAISITMKTRSSRQCRDRWVNYICPSLTNEPYSPEEDSRLLDMYSKFGPRWSKISTHFRGRSPNGLRAHFKELMQQKEKTSLEEKTNEVEPKLKVPDPSTIEELFLLENDELFNIDSHC